MTMVIIKHVLFKELGLLTDTELDLQSGSPDFDIWCYLNLI